MKKLFKLFVFALVLFVTTSTLVVNAKPIIERDDDNPDGVTPLALVSGEYSMEIEEESGVGYVYYTANGETEVLGTCTIVLVDGNNEAITIGNVAAGTVSYGSITIQLAENNKGYVQAVDGELANIFSVNDQMVITE